MIRMPHRSVTRFFIPLIDVLLLLFCIFLLMPIAREAELETERESVTELAYRVEQLEAELERRMQELKKFEDLRLVQADLEKLKEELDRLRKEAKKSVDEQIKVNVINIDPKGELFYYDPKTPNHKPLPIADKRTAQNLIGRHKEAAKGRKLFYYFLYPRNQDPASMSDFPSVGQERMYRDWFAEVEHNLPKEMGD